MSGILTVGVLGLPYSLTRRLCVIHIFKNPTASCGARVVESRATARAGMAMRCIANGLIEAPKALRKIQSTSDWWIPIAALGCRDKRVLADRAGVARNVPHAAADCSDQVRCMYLLDGQADRLAQSKHGARIRPGGNGAFAFFAKMNDGLHQRCIRWCQCVPVESDVVFHASAAMATEFERPARQRHLVAPDAGPRPGCTW